MLLFELYGSAHATNFVLLLTLFSCQVIQPSMEPAIDGEIVPPKTKWSFLLLIFNPMAHVFIGTAIFMFRFIGIEL
jgi:hypothetical protein